MNKEQIIASMPDSIKNEAIETMRKQFGIKERPMNPDSPDGRVCRVKIKDAKFFPNPPSFWKKSITLLYKMLSDDCDDYMDSWTYKGLRVVASVATYDGQEWLHVSFSRPNRIPDYNDIQLVKNNFIGEDRKAIMVWPEKEHYVNQHPYCLHLWQSEVNPLPVFDVEMNGIKCI